MSTQLQADAGSTPQVDLPALITSQTRMGMEITPAHALPANAEMEGPEFDPVAYLEESVASVLKESARLTVRGANFDDAYLMTLVESFDASAVPEARAVLDAVKRRDGGQALKDISQANNDMDQVERNVPKINPDYIEKIRRGEIWFKNMGGYIQQIADEVKDAANFWSSMLDEFEETEQKLIRHEKTMREGRVANNGIARREYIRSVNILRLDAMLHLMKKEIGLRIGEIQKELEGGPNQTLTEEQRRLARLEPIIQSMILQLEPLIKATENNGRIFTDQANANALQEFRVMMFRKFGISQWMLSTLQQLNSAADLAVELALEIGTKAMNESTERGTEAYMQQMARMANNVQKLMLELDEVRAQTQAVIQAGDLLIESFKKADDLAKKNGKSLEQDNRLTNEAHNRWMAQLEQIATGKAAPQAAA